MPRLQRGDVEAAFASAAHVFSGVTECSGQEHFYLETHCSIAQVDESGQVFVQCSTQHPSETQEVVAHVLGRPSHAVTVQCLRMGGGFGGKEMQPHGLAAVAALGAVLTGRPVRLRLSRAQDMTMTGKRHGFHTQWRVAFDDDGGLLALDATLTSDGGWSLDLSEPVMARALCHVDNAYWIPHVRVNGRIARTHKTSQTAFRGFGGPQGMLVIEDVLGRCAPRLGIDPADLRRRNFYRAGPADPLRPGRAPPGAGGDVLGAGRRDGRRRPAPDGGRGVQRDLGARQARHRGDAGEVRDRLQLHGVQPGAAPSCTSTRTAPCSSTTAAPRWARGCTRRCSRSRPRRSGCPSTWCGSPPPAPTRCPTPRPRPPARGPTSTVARCSTPAPRSSTGCARWRPSCSGARRRR